MNWGIRGCAAFHAPHCVSTFAPSQVGTAHGACCMPEKVGNKYRMHAFCMQDAADPAT
jgi:hypothetical protein